MAATEDVNIVSSFPLKGHRDSVLCLDHSSHAVTGDTHGILSSGDYLLSGSQDGTARLWDLKGSKRQTCLCISTQKRPVQACRFGGSVITADSSKGPGDAFLSVYLGVQDELWGYDLRMTNVPAIQILQPTDAAWTMASPTSHHPRTVEQDIATNHKDDDDLNEINQISTTIVNNYTTNYQRRRFVATACDDGTVRMIPLHNTDLGLGSPKGNDSSANQRITTLHHCDNNSNEGCLVTTAVFSPLQDTKTHSNTACLLASGGTDCTVRLWDPFKPRKPLHSISMVGTADNDHGNQIYNPPFVHHLVWNPSGTALLAGCGDGSIGVLSTEHDSAEPNSAPENSQARTGGGKRKNCNNKKKKSNKSHTDKAKNRLEGGWSVKHRLFDAHGGSIASLAFPGWDNPSASTSLRDRLFCSIGNDGMIALWDLEGSFPISTSDSCVPDLEKLKLSSGPLGPKTMLAWRHAEGKPNWIVSRQSPSPCESGTTSSPTSTQGDPWTLFVCDTSPVITVYQLPPMCR